MHRAVKKMALIAVLTLGTTAAARAAVISGANNGVIGSGTIQPRIAALLDTPIALNQWYAFGFGDVGSSFTNGDLIQAGINPTSLPAPDPAWTFTLPSGGGTLIVTDGFLPGDQFNVTDFGTSLGDTSSVPVSGAFCNNDIGACLSDPSFSHGSFQLAGGAHAISGTAIMSPYGSGGAFFEVTTSPAVPEPASLAILGAGLLGLGLAGCRRRYG